jgi:ankyrin repeat protein
VSTDKKHDDPARSGGERRHESCDGRTSNGSISRRTRTVSRNSIARREVPNRIPSSLRRPFAHQSDISLFIFFFFSLFFFYSFNGFLPLVNVLLSANADVNARDMKNVTPLHVAALKVNLF